MSAACSETLELFSAILDGETVADERQTAVAEHLNACAECARGARQLSSIHRLMFESRAEELLAAKTATAATAGLGIGRRSKISARAEPKLVLPRKSSSTLAQRASIITTIAALVLLSVGLWFGFRSPNAPAVAKDESIAELREVAGTVDVERAGQTRSGATGMKLLTGDVIRASASASIVYADGTRVQLSAATVAQLPNTHGKNVNLTRGRALANVAKQPAGEPMVFTTPHATATVLGTQLVLNVSAAMTQLDVSEGRVAFARASDSRSVEVAAGEYATSGANVLATRALPRGRFYYVSDIGHDANDGSHGKPFRQIARAASSASAGDTILVADGQYDGFGVANIGGNATSPLLILALGSKAEVSASPEGDGAISIADSSHVVIDGFRVTGGSRAAVRVDDSHHVAVRNCTLSSGEKHALTCERSDDILIEDNEMIGGRSRSGACSVYNSQRPVIRGNRIHGNAGSGVQIGSERKAGVLLSAGAAIEGNIIHDNCSRGGAGLNLDGIHDAVIRNNLFYNNRANGIALYREDGAAGPKNITIANNTIDVSPNGRYPLRLCDLSGSIKVRNNILLNRNESAGGISYGSERDASLTDSDFNIFAGNARIAVETAAQDDPGVKFDLAEWIARGREKHSKIAPYELLFKDEANHDYRLNDTSPAIDAGDDSILQVQGTDLSRGGRLQGQHVDIGAFEHQ